MAKCKECGEELIIKNEGKTGICPNCGNIYDLRPQEELDKEKNEKEKSVCGELKYKILAFKDNGQKDEALKYAKLWTEKNSGNFEAFLTLAKIESDDYGVSVIPFYFSGEATEFIGHINMAVKLADDENKRAIFEESGEFMKKLLLLETLKPLAVAKAFGRQLPTPDGSKVMQAMENYKIAQEEYRKAQEEEIPQQKKNLEIFEKELAEAEASPLPTGLFKGGAIKKREEKIHAARLMVGTVKSLIEEAEKKTEKLEEAKKALEEENVKYERACESGSKIKKAMAEGNIEFITLYFDYVKNMIGCKDRLKEQIESLKIYEEKSDPFEIYCAIMTRDMGCDAAGYNRQSKFYEQMNQPGGMADYYLWKQTANIAEMCEKLRAYRKKLEQIEDFIAE